MTELASDNPYVSVVVTSRNDNHGGNLLHRMQVFVDGLIEQCRRYRLNAELILVEWNPPADQPRFAQALNWPVDGGPCQVRIIEVPPEIHRRFQHSEQLPLFQMIAKNVGIRRAKGQFVLATNIDVLFSDELMEFLARNSLKPDRYYRVDRYDAAAEVPLGADIEEQLEFCEANLLRINTKNGTFNPNEKTTDSASPRPGIKRSPSWLQWAVLPFAPAILLLIYLRVLANIPVPAVLKNSKPYQKYWQPLRECVIYHPFWQWALLPFALPILLLIRLRVLANIPVPAVVKNSKPYQKYWQPLRERVTYHPFCQWVTGLFSGNSKLPWLHTKLPRLHTNACGDFTLMSRESWFALRGYAEFEMFSFHLDSLLCFAAYYNGVQEEVLEDSMRIYHIEHGSGWTPQAAEKLFNRIDDRGISRVTNKQLEEYVIKMSRWKETIFNSGSWGLAGEELPEVLVGGKTE